MCQFTSLLTEHFDLLCAGSERVNRVVTWKGSAVYIVKSNYDVLLV